MRFSTAGGLRLSIICCVGLNAAWLSAAEKTFSFKDPKGVNAMSFTLDSTVEPIMGLAKSVSGELTFDPDQPAALRGTLTVDASSLHCSNARMTDVLHGADWLGVADHPKVEFIIKEVSEVKPTRERGWELTVAGEFTLKNTTKPLTIKVKADYLPDKAGSRMRGAEGDLLVLRTSFQIKRTDFGIKPDQNTDVVSDEIDIRASIVGMTPRK